MTARINRNLDFIENIPVCSDAVLEAADWGAMEVAGRQFDKVRDQLQEGTFKVWKKVLIHGSISIGPTVQAATAGDTIGVLAWVLARLPANQKAAVAAAIQNGFEVTAQQRDFAKTITEPTRSSTIRRGALKGIVEVEQIE